MEHKLIIEKEGKAIISSLEEEYLSKLTPLQLVILTVISVYAINWMIGVVACLRKMTKAKLMEKAFRIASIIPQV